MKTLNLCLATLLLASGAFAVEPTVIPLWPNGAPGFEDKKDIPERADSYWVRNVHNPSITAYLPAKEKATGTAGVTISSPVANRSDSAGSQG